MFCSNCGKTLPDGAGFCDACGHRVQSNDTAAATAVENPILNDVPTVEIPVPTPAVPVPEVPVPPIPVPVPAAPVEQPKPRPEPQKTKRRKPHIGLRIPMQILSFVLCLVLMASLLATVVLADLNRVTSAGGIKQLINAVLVPNSAPTTVHPVGAAGTSGITSEEGEIPDDLLTELPEDVFTSDDPTGALVEWIMEMVEDTYGEELPVTQEQVESFLEKSTVTDFVAEKVASYAEDYINGTANTTITADEIMDLIEENEELLKEELNVTLTPEVKQELKQTVEDVVEETDLNTVIREEVFATVDEAIEENTASMGGMSRDELMGIVRMLTSARTLLLAIAVCLVLMLLICALNFYNVPGGLTWISVACMIMGLIVAAPVAVVQLAPDLLRSLLQDAGPVVPLLISFVGVLAPIHYGLFVLGLLILIGSIVWRIVRSSRAKKRSLAAA